MTTPYRVGASPATPFENEEARRELEQLIEEGRRIDEERPLFAEMGRRLDGEQPLFAQEESRIDAKPPLLARAAAVATLLWTLFGFAGLAHAASTMQNLDKGWFWLGLIVFQGPCAFINLVLLGLALEARWRSVIVACLTPMAMEAALVLFLLLL